jgi:hypothetical protein
VVSVRDRLIRPDVELVRGAGVLPIDGVTAIDDSRTDEGDVLFLVDRQGRKAGGIMAEEWLRNMCRSST